MILNGGGNIENGLLSFNNKKNYKLANKRTISNFQTLMLTYSFSKTFISIT